MNDVVFISIYGGFDSTLYNAKHDTSEDFIIKYSIPDDVDSVYLRGNTKDDVKIVW